MDFKVVFSFNDLKIAVHAYNSKQKLTVSGSNHVGFVTNCLGPFLEARINTCVTEADEFNKGVLNNLANKVRR